MLINNY